MNEMNNGREMVTAMAPRMAAKDVRIQVGDDGVRVTELTRDQLQSMRPTLIVAAGGSGHLTALHLVAILTRRFGDAWREKIRILVFDTTEESLQIVDGGRRVRLEPGVEFFNIGNVPVANILRNIHNLDSIDERFGAVLNRLPRTSLRNGAKSMPPLGLLALYWHYPLIKEQLRRALWALAERNGIGAEIALQQQGINVILISSIVGGTGAGLILDLSALTRTLFDDLGAQGEFCHITGIVFLPQAFPGVPPTNLQANAGASLQEIGELIMHGDFKVCYPDGRRVHVRQAPFDLLYVLDGVDERGQTWSGIDEIAAMAAEGIYLQIGSQLGRKGDNVFDNMDEVLMGRTSDGEGTYLASFGMGHLEFPAPLVAEICARRLLAEQIDSVWLSPTQGSANSVQAPLQVALPEHLENVLSRDPQGGELRLDLRQPRWLQKKAHNEVANEAIAYVREYGHSRVNEGLVRKVEQNGRARAGAAQKAWTAWVNSLLFSPQMRMNDLLSQLQEAQSQTRAWLEDNRRHLQTLVTQAEQQAEAVRQAESQLVAAAESLLIGRRGRVRKTLDDLFAAAGELFETQVQVAQCQAQRQVWGELASHLASLEKDARTLADRLESIAARMEEEANTQLQEAQSGGVSRLSLADEAHVGELYEEHAPELLNLQIRLAQEDLLALAAQPTEALGETLLAAVRPLFEPIARLTVEQVIAARSDEMSPRARRQQLFRLATPSWNVDRARLPQGGSELKRIEVMGVPDAAATLFDDEVTRVSTHDPHRLTALVVAAGAPAGALQQHEAYQRALEEVRRHRPVHVLPQFLVDAGQARLAFALGSIFGFIYSQGAHFYYQPADELESARRLENGLARAMAVLEGEDGLVREIMERAEAQIARMGLQKAIQALADYYSTVPEGRTALDDLVRDLKQRVREYAAELRQINDYRSGLKD